MNNIRYNPAEGKNHSDPEPQQLLDTARTMERAQKSPALTAGGSSDAEIATPTSEPDLNQVVHVCWSSTSV